MKWFRHLPDSTLVLPSVQVVLDLKIKNGPIDDLSIFNPTFSRADSHSEKKTPSFFAHVAPMARPPSTLMQWPVM